MNKNKKILLIISIALVSILLITGVTYAALSYTKTGVNQELIVGDIWMKYKETNQLVLEDAMPVNIDNYMRYQVNPIMTTQEVVDNELGRCVSFFTDKYFGSANGSVVFCQGIGDYIGYSFQETIELDFYSESELQEMISLNIILQDSEGYVVNPIMSTQEINELTSCASFYSFLEFHEGSTSETFCKGSGITLDGLTFQQFLNINKDDEDFINFGVNILLNEKIIFFKIENLPYFEFEVSGKNTYTKKDIWYEIVLNHGDSHETRTTRIRDDLLRFSLVEIKDGVETTVINNKKYDDLINRRIWANTINKNTNEDIEIKYRLYMWIDKSTVIGNNGEDYTLAEWEDVFATIKVNVTGDFKEKVLTYEEMYDVTDATCFETINTKVYVANPIMANQTIEEVNELTACVKLYSGVDMNYEFDEGSTVESFCKGTGTANGYTIQEDLNNWINNAVEYNYDFLESGGQKLLDNGIIIQDGDSYKVNPLMQTQEIEVANELTTCTLNFSFYEDAESFCKGTSEDRGLAQDLYQYIFSSNELVQLKNDNIIIESQGLAITDYNISCGSDVVIPKTINGNNVVSISSKVFEDKRLSNVVFPDTILEIRWRSFRNNDILRVNIPDSVVYLDCDAFDYFVSINTKNNLVCVNDQV